MKSKYKLSGLGIIIIIIMLIFLNPCIYRAKAADTVRLKNGAMEISSKRLSARISFGYKGNTKYGKRMKVCAVINNKRIFFSGKFRITYKTGKNGGLKMIQKSFSVEGGESRKVQFAIPLLSESQEYIVSVCDSSGKICLKANTVVNADTDTTGIYVGVLSDTPAKLGYMADCLGSSEKYGMSDNGVTGKVFEMNASDFEQEDILDTVDIVVIDNYNTGKFSNANIKVLKRWVDKGGTLVVGTGSNYQKEFEKLYSTLLRGYIGRTKRIVTDFGWNEDNNSMMKFSFESSVPSQIEMDIVELNLKEDDVLIKDNDNKLMVSKNYGEGSIIVAEFSFNLKKSLWNSYGKAVMTTIEENLSEGTKKKMLLQNEIVSPEEAGYSFLDEALKINENDVLPNMVLYGCILGVYITIAGPGLYLIFKRRKRRSRLWIAVPVLAIAFSAIIYIVGTSTRIQRPYINYLSQIVLSDGQISKTKDMTTLFSVTGVSNDSFSADIAGKCNVIPKESDEYTGKEEIGNIDINDYDYGVDYGQNKTKLIMNKMSSFQSANFVMKQKVKNSGNIIIKVSEEDMQLVGKMTNTLGYDLNNCMIYYQGNLLYIGDIKKDETIDVEKIARSSTYNKSEYGDSDEAMIESVMGGTMYSSGVAASLKRKIGVVEEYLEDNSNAKAWFYGFVQEGHEETFTDKFDYDKYGVTGVCKNFSMTEKIDGYDVIDNLETYASEYNSEYTNGYDVYQGAPERFAVTYRFPKNFMLKELVYSKQTSSGAEFSTKKLKYADYGFYGVVSIKNKETNKYEKLFSSGKETKIINMSDYLDADGSLTLYYSVEYISSKELGNLCLPEVKLAGNYEKETSEIYFTSGNGLTSVILNGK